MVTQANGPSSEKPTYYNAVFICPNSIKIPTNDKIRTIQNSDAHCILNGLHLLERGQFRKGKAPRKQVIL